MADAINMFDVAKKLIPNIEENMPDAVREAFEGGKVKSIFRTGGRDLTPGTELRSNAFGGASAMPSSHYFLLDDGRAARFGSDDFGDGWMGARASVPSTIMTQDDPFVFDKILFGDSGETPLSLGDDISKSLPSGVSSDPIVGKNIFETFSKDGKVVNYHGGNSVKDIYRRDGTATFFDDAVNPVRGTKPNLVTSKIEDLNFFEKKNMKGNSVMVPELKSGSAPTPAVAAPTPTSPTEPASRLRGKGVGSPTPPPPDTVTAAGRNRPMVAANYDKMSDDDLLKHYASTKANYEKQLIIDPDGKAFMPTAKGSMESVEKQLRARGIHPDDAAPSVAKASATKVTPLVDEYDTGGTAAKVASGETLTETPPVTKPRGPGGLGTAADIKTKPGPHGVADTTPMPPTVAKTPITPDTSPTGPTAKIVTKTAKEDVDLTAREALRRMGGDIKAARKPSQKLLSADGSKAMAEAVTKGIKGSRNLKMLAVGSALGLGGYTANRIANRGDTSDLRG